MVKAVFDTNILISGLLYPGKPSRLIDLAVTGEIELILSVDIINEFASVISRPRFRLTRDEQLILIRFVLRLSHIIVTRSKLKIVKDDQDDDIVIITAFDGKVPYIVSGDLHLLDLNGVLGIKVLTANEMLKLFGK